jgi:PHD/YefM family antitoxin component YafN of YafNO toxin-antitoxin module
MTALEALQSVQYVTVKGKRLAVLSAEDWEALIEWLETLEDIQAARQALAELKAAGNDRGRAGWLPWDTLREELV